MTFSAEQITALQAPLSQSAVKTRQQSGRSLSYVEGWHAIAEANRIFGFDAWTSETLEVRCVSERNRKIGKPPYEKDGWGVSYTAKVRVTVGDTVREGIGAGHGIDADLGLAHESAIKEAETDARKRALMTFGNPFGLALYDKEQRNVSDDRAPARQEAPRPQPQLVQSNPADEEERDAYMSLARSALMNAEFANDIDLWWQGQSGKRREYGILKGTSEYDELVGLARTVKARLPADITAAG
jgi:DNA repair and recombination protein RAD52